MLLALSNKINPTDLAGKNITPHRSLKYVVITYPFKSIAGSPRALFAVNT